LRIGLHYGLASGEGNFASLKLLEEARAGGMSDQDMPPTRWELEHRAIFGDDDVEARQVSCDVMKIRQTASRDKDDDDPTSPRLANSLTHGRIEYAIHGNCAVVINGKGREFHSISENTTKSASAAVLGEAAAPICVTF